MKRIVMIAGPVQSIPPKKGAAVEWWMLQVCRQLARLQLEPHVIAIAAPDQPLHEVIDGVTVHRIRFGTAYRRVFQKITRLDPLSYAHRAAQIVRRIDAELIHVHNAPELAAELLGKLPQRQVLLHAHNEFAAHRMPHGIPLMVVSKSLAAHYQGQSLPVAAVIPNGIDATAFQSAMPATLPLPDQALRQVILYAGRVSPEKGLLHLAHALPHLVKQKPDVLLLLAGEQRASGSAHDTRAVYTKQVNHALAACPDHHLWLGSMAPEDMPGIYKTAALVVVPSVFAEPFGMVALEAMAAGTPVLAAPRGGLPEFVMDGDTGFHIARAHDADPDGSGLATQIAALLDAPAKRQAVALRAQNHATANFRWDQVAARALDAYRQLSNTGTLAQAGSGTKLTSQ